MADLTPLKQFLSQNPHIHHAIPSSPDFSSLRATFLVNDAVQPLMIVRPQSADDVSGLVSVFTTHSIPFTVRAGGHDMFSRSIANDSVTIDMRDIAYVSIDKASSSARVGGGTIIRDLEMELAKEDLATPTGMGAIGYVGWATHGGYGFLNPGYGLGVDQILGAKIVNGEGKIVEADEKLLKGIRGAGGTFGVIVELTIKVYPMTTVLGGVIFFGSGKDVASSYKQFNDGYRALCAEGLPTPLRLHQAVMNPPQGRTFGVLFFWGSSDFEAGEVWREKICSLAPMAMHTVVKCTIPEWSAGLSAVVADHAFGKMVSVSFKELTPEVVDVFATFAEEMPADPSTMFNYHELRGISTESYPDSVFAQRQPHYVAELCAIGSSEESFGEIEKWATELREAILKTDPNNLLPTRYISFADPPTLNLREVYEDHYETVAELKKIYDPQNVFTSAYARF
ncbi:hypothetical protein FQN54_003058 [Arachnomyces sp. PD_36]|nr:hypothetical protein FQN54_003058 [Arachnomyces sp. PD_36]